MNFDSFKEFKFKKNNNNSKKKKLSSDDLELEIEKLYNEYNAYLSQSLIKKINTMDLVFLKEISINLIQKLGYQIFDILTIENVNSNNDEIHGVIFQDRLCLDKIAVLIKFQKNGEKVDLDLLQRFVGILFSQGLQKGAILTNSKFNQEALEFINLQWSIKVR